MKILVATLFIALVVFLNDVELSVPPGRGQEPSERGPTPMGWGLVPMAWGPAPTRFVPAPMVLGPTPIGLGRIPMVFDQTSMGLGAPRMERVPALMGRERVAFKGTRGVLLAGLFYKDEQGVLKPVPNNTSLFELDSFYIGILSGRLVLPLLNSNGKIVLTEKHNPSNRRIVSPEWAQRYGIPGTVAEVLRTIEVRRNEERQAKIPRTKDALERLRRHAAEN